MSGDDCIKVIAAIATAQVGIIVALGKVYVTVMANQRRIDHLARVKQDAR